MTVILIAEIKPFAKLAITHINTVHADVEESCRRLDGLKKLGRPASVSMPARHGQMVTANRQPGAGCISLLHSHPEPWIPPRSLVGS